MGKKREPSRSFRGAMFGFRKTDVMNYVDWVDQEHQKAVAALCDERDSLREEVSSLSVQLAETQAALAVSSGESERRAMQIAEQSARIANLDASMLALSGRLTSTESTLSETQAALQAAQTTAEEQRLELAQCRMAAEAETKACLQLLCEMQKTAEEMHSLGCERMEAVEGESIACLAGMEEAMTALLDRIGTMRNGISDVRVLMENGHGTSTDTFTTRLTVMQERMEALKNNAVARLTAAPAATPVPPEGPAESPAETREEPRPKTHVARPSGSVRVESTDMRSRLFRLLEGLLGKD